MSRSSLPALAGALLLSGMIVSCEDRGTDAVSDAGREAAFAPRILAPNGGFRPARYVRIDLWKQVGGSWSWFAHRDSLDASVDTATLRVPLDTNVRFRIAGYDLASGWIDTVWSASGEVLQTASTPNARIQVAARNWATSPTPSVPTTSILVPGDTIRFQATPGQKLVTATTVGGLDCSSGADSTVVRTAKRSDSLALWVRACANDTGLIDGQPHHWAWKIDTTTVFPPLPAPRLSRPAGIDLPTSMRSDSLRFIQVAPSEDPFRRPVATRYWFRTLDPTLIDSTNDSNWLAPGTPSPSLLGSDSLLKALSGAPGSLLFVTVVSSDSSTTRTSAVLHLRTRIVAPVRVDAPAGLVVSAKTDTTLLLRWAPVPSCSTFFVFDTGSARTILRLPPGQDSVVLRGLTAGETVDSIRVRAVPVGDTARSSDWSSPLVATTRNPPGALPAPDSSWIDSASGPARRWIWTKLAGATDSVAVVAVTTPSVPASGFTWTARVSRSGARDTLDVALANRKVGDWIAFGRKCVRDSTPSIRWVFTRVPRRPVATTPDFVRLAQNGDHFEITLSGALASDTTFAFALAMRQELTTDTVDQQKILVGADTLNIARFTGLVPVVFQARWKRRSPLGLASLDEGTAQTLQKLPLPTPDSAGWHLVPGANDTTWVVVSPTLPAGVQLSLQVLRAADQYVKSGDTVHAAVLAPDSGAGQAFTFLLRNGFDVSAPGRGWSTRRIALPTPDLVGGTGMGSFQYYPVPLSIGTTLPSGAWLQTRPSGAGVWSTLPTDTFPIPGYGSYIVVMRSAATNAVSTVSNSNYVFDSSFNSSSIKYNGWLNLFASKAAFSSQTGLPLFLHKDDSLASYASDGISFSQIAPTRDALFGLTLDPYGSRSADFSRATGLRFGIDSVATTAPRAWLVLTNPARTSWLAAPLAKQGGVLDCRFASASWKWLSPTGSVATASTSPSTSDLAAFLSGVNHVGILIPGDAAASSVSAVKFRSITPY